MRRLCFVCSAFAVIFLSACQSYVGGADPLERSNDSIGLGPVIRSSNMSNDYQQHLDRTNQTGGSRHGSVGVTVHRDR